MASSSKKGKGGDSPSKPSKGERKPANVTSRDINQEFDQLKNSNFEDLSPIARILGLDKLNKSQDLLLSAYIGSLKKQTPKLDEDQLLAKIKEFLGGGGCGRK